MAAQTYPLPIRFSRWLLACAVRHWPEETRSWGRALAAEVDETTDALETLLWSWGGIMLFARSVVGSVVAWLKLPAGSRNGGAPVEFGTGRDICRLRSCIGDHGHEAIHMGIRGYFLASRFMRRKKHSPPAM